MSLWGESLMPVLYDLSDIIHGGFLCIHSQEAKYPLTSPSIPSSHIHETLGYHITDPGDALTRGIKGLFVELEERHSFNDTHLL